MRKTHLHRKTNETSIEVEIDLDGTGQYDVKTGIGFLDHMLEQFSRHSLIDVCLKGTGDTHIDFHHLTEDSGLALGAAVSQALGNRCGLTRYGMAFVPMDEALTRVTIDLSNRPYLVWDVFFSQPKIGVFDTELCKEWFQAFSQSAGITMHVSTLYGKNCHHIAESCFKALARAFKQAIAIEPRAVGIVPSTKGVLSGSL